MKSLKTNIPLFFIYTITSKLIFQRGIFILFLKQKGMSFFEIGLLQFSLFFSNIITEVPAGFFADKYGRKISLILGTFLFAINGAGFLAFESFEAFLLLFIIEGFAFSFISGSDEAIFFDTLKNLGKKESYLKFSSRINFIASFSLGTAILIGGMLREISWDFVYGSYTAFMILTLMILIFISEPTTSEDEKISDETKLYNQKWKVLKFIKSSKLWMFFIILTFLEMITTPYYVFSQHYFDQLALNAKTIGLIFCAIEFASGFLNGLANQLRSKMKFHILITVLYLCVAISMFLIGLNRTSIAIIVFFIVVPISSLNMIIFMNEIQHKTPSKIRASIISSISFCHSLMAGFSYVLYGYLIERIEISRIFSLSAIFPLLAIALIWKLKKRIQLTDE